MCNSLVFSSSLYVLYVLRASALVLRATYSMEIRGLGTEVKLRTTSCENLNLKWPAAQIQIAKTITIAQHPITKCHLVIR